MPVMKFGDVRAFREERAQRTKNAKRAPTLGIIDGGQAAEMAPQPPMTAAQVREGLHEAGRLFLRMSDEGRRIYIAVGRRIVDQVSDE